MRRPSIPGDPATGLAVAVIPHASSVNTALSAGTTSSATYVNIPGTSVTLNFTKYETSTKLIVTGLLTNIYNTSGVFPVETLGVSVNGTDYPLGTSSTPGASIRHDLNGVSQEITGLSPGTYAVTLRIKVGAGAFTTDANGIGSLRVEETY